MSYTFNEKEANSLIPQGEYEVKLERIDIKTTNNGKEKLVLMFRIRDDIENQKYGNKCIFENIWKEKDGILFNTRRLNQLLGTQEIKDGTRFETINEVISFLVGSYLIVKVSVAFNDYFNEEENKIDFYKKTKCGAKKIESEKNEDLDDEDLPF